MLVRLINLKRRMDQLMYYYLADVRRIAMFHRQNGWAMRALRLLSWIVVSLALLCAANLFLWFIINAKSIIGSGIGFRSRRARVNAFFNNDPWMKNDTIVAVSTAVKPIHVIEYHVNQTQLMMGSGKGRVTGFIDNPWTKVKPIHVIEYVNNTDSVKPIRAIEYVNEPQLMMGSRKGRVIAFIDNPWTENDTIVSVKTTVKPIHLIEYVNNTGSGAANEQSI